jgi:hypothetical protein
LAAIAGWGEFAKIHLARRRASESVEAKASGQDSNGQRVTKHCFHKYSVVGSISLFRTPEFPALQTPGKWRNTAESSDTALRNGFFAAAGFRHPIGVS